MKTIKFRIYDKQNNKIIESGATPSMLKSFFEHTAVLHTKDEMPYLQFTGLLDRNGVEIYEGDICKVDDGDNIYEVIFYMGGFRLAVLPRKIRVYDIGSGLFKNIEIIETAYKFMDTAKQDAECNPRS